ncbi:nickel transporter permease [Candidatus Bipolaricaulota bacterium]
MRFLEIKRRLRRFARNKLALCGALVIGALIVTAFLAPVIAPYGPLDQNIRARLSPPSASHLFGTDALGRDLLSRIIHGARVSLLTGIFVVGSAALVGTALGALAGYFGGWIDKVVMRTVDVFLAFPGMILALAIAGVLGPGLFNMMIALLITAWPSYCRVVRSAVLSIREQEYIESARAVGASNWRIIWRQVLPNCLPPVFVLASMGMGVVILAAAGLSFLGLGAQPPHPEWGSMLNAAKANIMRAPYLSIFPGLAILFSVLGFNFLGDGLRDMFDPRSR